MRGQATVSPDGSTFLVGDARGDLDSSADDAQGLFHRNTRYLSRWRLTVDGATPADAAAYSIIRQRTIGAGFREELTIRNQTSAWLELELRIEAAADFADRLAAVGAPGGKGRRHQLTEPGRLVLGHTGQRSLRETWISASSPQARLQEDGITFDLRIEPYGAWTTCLDVVIPVGACRGGRRRAA